MRARRSSEQHASALFPRYRRAQRRRPPPDYAEENDKAAQATNLQRVEGVVTLPGLSIEKAGDQDSYVFQTAATGVQGHRVEIAFDHGQGDLSLALFAANKTTLLEQSQGISNREVISLAGRAAGACFYVRVLGVNSSTRVRHTI